MDSIGVMMSRVWGESADLSKYIGKRIRSAEIKGEQELRIIFDDGTGIMLTDDGQSCCERRYMHTDDDLNSIAGHELRRIELKDGPTKEDAYGDSHEQQFLEIGTDQGFVTIVNHNEHNGYYGGFAIKLAEIEGE